MRKPTADQARLFAEMLDAGVLAGDAVDLVCPESELGERPDLAEAWPMVPSVLKARMTITGAWLEMSPEARQAAAVKLAYNSMAYALMKRPVGELDGAALNKHMTFLKAIEQKIAGNAGASDGLAKFLEQFKQAGWTPKGKKATTEAVQ